MSGGTIRRNALPCVWHGVVAAGVLLALVLQVIVAVRAPGSPPAHAVGTLAGAPAAGRLLRVASFFTIQSNILLAVTSAQLALRPQRDGFVWRILRLDALVGIAVTGIVYATVLARIHEPNGWEQIVSNATFHYAAPLSAVLGWLIVGPRPRINRQVVAGSLLWPVLWFVYTLVRGRLSQRYPYPFVDAAAHGYGRVFVNALLVLLVLAAVACIYLVRQAPLPGAISRRGALLSAEGASEVTLLRSSIKC